MPNPAASPAVSSTVGLKNMVIAPLTVDTEETLTFSWSPAQSRHPSRPRTPIRMYNISTIRKATFCIPIPNCRLKRSWLICP